MKYVEYDQLSRKDDPVPRHWRVGKTMMTHVKKRELIINALRAAPEGLTKPELAEATGLCADTKGTLDAMLRREHGVSIYIDHWAKRKKMSRWTAVYMLVDCPEDCPMPDKDD